MSLADSRARLMRNPFYLLELNADCSRAELERAGQRLLAMIELALPGSERVETPYGVTTRSADDLRQALADLRDPERRLVHELWFRSRPWTAMPPVGAGEPEALRPWTRARAAFGWRRW